MYTSVTLFLHFLFKSKECLKTIINLLKQEKSQELASLTNKISFLEKEIRNLQLKLPNILHKSVPIGKDSTKIKVIRKC